MNLKEAYTLYFGKTDEIINERFISSELTKEIVKQKYRQLMRTNHPDAHPEATEKYNEITRKIIEANEVLNKALDKKINYHKQSPVRNIFIKNSEPSKIVKAYKEALKQMYEIRSYFIITELKKNLSYFRNEIMNSASPEEVYTLRKEANEISEQAKAKLTSLKQEYLDITNKVSSRYISDEELEGLFKRFAEEHYNDWDNPFVLNDLNLWDKNEDLRKIDINLSYINNIKNKLKNILATSNDVNIAVRYLILSNMSNDVLSKLKAMKNTKEKIILWREFLRKEDHHLITIGNWDQESRRLMILLDDMDQKDITEDFIKQINIELIASLTNKSLKVLNNPNEINRLNTQLRQNKDTYQKNKKKAAKEFKKAKKELLEIIKKDSCEIKEISQIYQTQTGKKIKFDKPTNSNKQDDDNVFDTYCYFETQLAKSQRVAIDLFYHTLINYYAYTGNFTVDLEIDQIYSEYCSGKTEDLNKIYTYLKNKYIKEIDASGYRVTKETDAVAKRNICFEIDSFLDFCKKRNLSLAPELALVYRNKESLSTSKLYKLYNDIINSVCTKHQTRV